MEWPDSCCESSMSLRNQVTLDCVEGGFTLQWSREIVPKPCASSKRGMYDCLPILR
jgi:hypothetical protein